MSASPSCVRCGEPVAPGARYCTRCGADVSRIAGSVATLAVRDSSEAPARDTLVELLREATLGEYEILDELGRGGMATVYVAHEIALDRKVAIKVISPALLAGAGMVERFKREARTAASLSHPHIIPIYAVKETERILYFVMKLVEGRSLDSIIREVGPLPVPMVQAILQQAGGALAYAHRRGIIHRDVKPANIMLDNEGWAVVTDFGIAKISAAQAQALTMTGVTVGTPSYMSPEQCAAKQVTGASDQYSLGVVLYEMLTGKPPFVADSIMALMYAHFNETPSPVRHERPDCPSALDAAVMRMLEKAPEKRWPTIDEAIAASGGVSQTQDELTRLRMTELAMAGGSTEVLRRISTPTSPIPPAKGGTLHTADTFAPVAAVKVAPLANALLVGQSVQLAVTVRDAKGAARTDRPITWSSSAPEVATVSPGGVVTAVAAGSASITATSEAVSGNVSVTATAPPERQRAPRAAVAPAARPRGFRVPLVLWGVAAIGVAVVVWRLGPWRGTSGGKPGESSPPPALVAAVAVSPATSSVSVGETVQLVASAQDARGQTLGGGPVSWTSSDSSVALVSPTGLVIAVAAGAARITATSETKTGSATVTVTMPRAPPALPAPPTGVATIAVAPARWTLSVGETMRLVATLEDARGVALGGRSVIWSSAENAVATVTATGLVTAVGAGSTRITVTSERRSASAIVTVTAPPPPPPVTAAAITVGPTLGVMKAGDTARLTAIPRDAEGGALTDRAIQWRSSSPSVATVSPSGLVTAVTPGSAAITAASEGQHATVDVTVVSAPPSDTQRAPPLDRAAAAREIAAVLDEFARALESRQMTRVRGVYPDMSREEQNRWATLLESRDVSDFHARLTQQEAPTIDESTAEVGIVIALDFRNPSQGHVVSGVRYRATLARGTGGWRLRSLQQQ